MSEFNESLALQGLKTLDPQVIGAIYDHYFTEVYRYVRYRTGDDAIAEDIASEVFLRLLEAAKKKQEPASSLKGWLIAVASNAINDHLRRRYRRPETELSDSLPDNSSSVASQVDARVEQEVVQTAYAHLTDEQQRVLALRFGLGYSLEETALHLKKNINAVKALQFRALASLQREMGEVNHD